MIGIFIAITQCKFYVRECVVELLIKFRRVIYGQKPGGENGV